jgi:hypothetical protein
MDYDTYGEVINGEKTYKGIAEELGSNSVLIGWTDNNGTHFDILFTLSALTYGTNIQGGVRGTDLFISIMRRGAFGFEKDHEDTHAGYYDEKLGGGMGSTSEALAELINGVKKELSN